MYNGRLKLGIIIYFSIIIYTFVILETGLVANYTGLFYFLILTVLLYLTIIIHAIKLARAHAEFKSKKYNKPIFYIIWILIVYFSSTYITEILRYNPYRIPTLAMEPTLLPGDHIYVDKRVTYNEISPSDIIVFEYPLERDLSYVKRCIGTQGMEVEIIDKKVFVNGTLFNDSGNVQYSDDRILAKNEGGFYFPTLEQGKYGSRDNFGPIVVPDNELFVLGDNRDFSSDSRAWGFVPAEHLIGKVEYIYFSVDPRYKFYDLSNYIRFSRIGKTLR
jgi:signal peptidase I